MVVPPTGALARRRSTSNSAVRMAAAEAGVPAWDSAYGNFRDMAHLAEEAALARRLGFAGKSAIHPSQVAVINDAFRPTADEIAHAARVIVSARQARLDGKGAWQVDGRMIDAPFVMRALGVARTAQRLPSPKVRITRTDASGTTTKTLSTSSACAESSRRFALRRNRESGPWRP